MKTFPSLSLVLHPCRYQGLQTGSSLASVWSKWSVRRSGMRWSASSYKGYERLLMLLQQVAEELREMFCELLLRSTRGRHFPLVLERGGGVKTSASSRLDTSSIEGLLCSLFNVSLSTITPSAKSSLRLCACSMTRLTFADTAL